MGELCALPGEGRYQLGAAGDSFNTAVYLARAGVPTEYLTCLGDDPLSSLLMARIREEGVGCEQVRILRGRQAGIYMVTNDAEGERHFTYWRQHSAARTLFEEPLELTGLSSFYFTGITLGVTRSGADNLVRLLEQLRKASCAIIFDPNYRPVLWDDREQARRIIRRVLPLCDLVFPTLEDEELLWGIEDVEACVAFYREQGVGEVVVKAPDLTAHVWTPAERVSRPAARVTPLDTTGAGDAFNAGYLSVRLGSGEIDAALEAAQILSARVVQHRGAILPA